VKHWDAVSAFFVNLWNKITGAFSAAFNWIREKLAGVSNWVLGAVAVFLPFIGIPLLIIKNWDTIAAFFVGLWARITGWVVSAWEAIKTFFASLWGSIVEAFTIAWSSILGFFTSVWNNVVAVVITVANWFAGVWQTVTGAFAAAWGWVSELFVSVWDGIKGVVLGFVEWLSPVIDMILAPFRAVGNVIGGIVGTVKGWFGETVDIGKTEIAAMNENRARVTGAGPVEAAAPTQTATSIAAPSLVETNVIAAPSLAGSAAPVSALSAGTTTAAGANTALAEHLAAASRKGIEGMVNTSASDAFMGAGASVVPGIDTAEFESGAAVNFQEAVRPRQAAVETPWNAAEPPQTKKETPRVFNIQSVNLNADDIYRLLDFARQLELAVMEPVEAEV
jgi:hypothetical protein